MVWKWWLLLMVAILVSILNFWGVSSWINEQIAAMEKFPKAFPGKCRLKIRCFFFPAMLIYRSMRPVTFNPSLKHLKIDGWKMKCPFGMGNFQGRAVSFREGNSYWTTPWKGVFVEGLSFDCPMYFCCSATVRTLGSRNPLALEAHWPLKPSIKNQNPNLSKLW